MDVGNVEAEDGRGCSHLLPRRLWTVDTGVSGGRSGHRSETKHSQDKGI